MYLSPETLMDNVQEAPSDVWALGCIVLEMLTGKPAWDGEKGVEILRRIEAAEMELPKIPAELSEEAKDFLKPAPLLSINRRRCRRQVARKE